MTGATIRMAANKQATLQDIHERIHNMVGAEQVSKSAQTINGVAIWMLTYKSTISEQEVMPVLPLC